MKINYPIQPLEFESSKPKKDSVEILVLNNIRKFKKNTVVINSPVNRAVTRRQKNYVGVWKIKSLTSS